MVGKIIFDPQNKTKKHIKQSEWKRVVILQFDDDFDAMWRWYLQKRFNLTLQKPLRGSHITIVNDKFSSLKEQSLWEDIKKKYNGDSIQIYPPRKLRSSGKHWWLKIEDIPMMFTILRRDLKLGDPFFSFHLTIGLANEKHIDHSNYIKRLLIKMNKTKNQVPDQ